MEGTLFFPRGAQRDAQSGTGLQIMSDELGVALQSAVVESKSPGAVAYVGKGDVTLFHGACGARQLIPKSLPAEKDTFYDLASLTKVVATTTSVMLLYEEGLIDFDAPVSTYLPIPAFGQFTVRHCLTHTAGLVPGRPYYKECSSLNEMLQRYAGVDLEWPPGTRRQYSDVGFMILGKVVELVARDSLDAFCAKRIFSPLGMRCTRFNPPKEWAARCAATEKCAWRGKVIVGVVHDENAYAVGGVSGHAGLFSTAEDLARFCRALLGGKLLSEKTLSEMTRLGQVPFYPWQGLGWKVDPWVCGSEGFLPARTAMGHTGWTGTSIWIDRRSGVFVILLANTCHPTRDARDTAALRRMFHDGVAQRLFPDRSNVHTGLDRLVWDGFAPVRGKRIALLTNHAAVDQLGRPILDVLALDPAVKLRTVYTPEHGFQGKTEAGKAVKSETGAVPFVSLYGERRRPSGKELSGIDLFVVDLPDVGARYYTYVSTMRDCLAACAEAKKPALVLDRPNPVGGEILEGPIATETASAVCCAPIPIRHGMTMGELALFFSNTTLKDKKLALSINELDGWRRKLLFAQCALPWEPPSPNIPTPETALLYVGACLFEGANLNEGRGTETPFMILGAPWLDAEAVVRAIVPEDCAGCSLHATRYTPKSIPGKAASPRYCDETCNGIRIEIGDPLQVRAFRLATALLVAVRKLHPDHLELKKGFDVLAGTPELRKLIEAGLSASEIVSRYGPALDAFNNERPLRYPSRPDSQAAPANPPNTRAS